MTIDYQGDLEGLIAAVGRSGLSLAEESDGWRLRAAGGLVDIGACGRTARYTLNVVAGNVANLLTLARLLCVAPIVWLVRSGDYHAAALVFVGAALTDLADGYVAKRYDQITPLGAILDPIADKLLMDSLFLTLAFAGHLPVWLALLVIGRDVLIVLGTLALRMLAGRFRVEPLLVGKLSTFFQIVLGGAVLI